MLLAAIFSWSVAALGLAVGIFDAQLHWEGWALFGLGLSIGIVLFIRLESGKRLRR
jgi:hypothetical protein